MATSSKIAQSESQSTSSWRILSWPKVILSGIGNLFTKAWELVTYRTPAAIPAPVVKTTAPESIFQKTSSAFSRQNPEQGLSDNLNDLAQMRASRQKMISSCSFTPRIDAELNRTLQRKRLFNSSSRVPPQSKPALQIQRPRMKRKKKALNLPPAPVLTGCRSGLFSARHTRPGAVNRPRGLSTMMRMGFAFRTL